MPIHDWSRIPSGIFHDFHQTWCIHIKAALNAGLLPKGMSALVDQRAGPKEGDVLTVESRRSARSPDATRESELLTMDPPATSIVRKMGDVRAAYVEPIGVGDPLPAMPLFLEEGRHIQVPLESTYLSTWDATPEEMRNAVETGVMPEGDVE